MWEIYLIFLNLEFVKVWGMIKVPRSCSFLVEILFCRFYHLPAGWLILQVGWFCHLEVVLTCSMQVRWGCCHLTDLFLKWTNENVLVELIWINFHLLVCNSIHVFFVFVLIIIIIIIINLTLWRTLQNVIQTQKCVSNQKNQLWTSMFSSV